MFCRIAGAQSAEQSVGIMGSRAFDPNIDTKEPSPMIRSRRELSQQPAYNTTTLSYLPYPLGFESVTIMASSKSTKVTELI